jgi:two-component system chemotaxis response regulator CheB
MPYKVLIVDDSSLMRQLLTQILGSDPELEVIGAASDPFAAREKIKALHPDVLTLDVEMPRMDGLTFLEKLMRGHPMPVVMISSLTERGAETTLRALSLGAVDYVAKPKLDVSSGTIEQASEIIAKVKAAAKGASPRSEPARDQPGHLALRLSHHGNPQSHRHRSLNRRHRSVGGFINPAAAGLSRSRDGAAYAGSIHPAVFRAIKWAMQNPRAGSSRW